MIATFPTAPARPERPVLRLIAQGLGLTCVLLAGLGVVLAKVSYTACGYSVLVFLLLVPLSLAAVILGFVARSPLSYRASGSALLVALLMFFYGYGFPPCGERIVSNDASAVGSLRTIVTAATQYSSTLGKGYPASLRDLGPEGADLIDSVLAGGQKSGFRFEYVPAPPDAQGRIAAFTAHARPLVFGTTGFRNLYVDETGVVRVTHEDRPATASDPPIN